MEYSVLVKEINPYIDEEVTIEVNLIKLICFAPFGLPDLKVGNEYKARIGITVLDDLDMKEARECLNGFSQVDNSFSYFVSGTFDLESRTLDAGILIEFDEDEFDLHDYSYLDGKNIIIRVDRINVEFVDFDASR